MGDRGTTRRGFLAATAGAATALGGLGVGRAQPMAGRVGEVVQVFQPGVTRGRDQVVEALARNLIDRALTTFTGERDPVSALARYIDVQDVVGLKVNALASPGHAFLPAMTWRLVEHLKALGVPAGRIIIYDQYGDRMRKGGYRPRRKKGDVRVLYHALTGYDAKPVRFDRVRELKWCRTIREVTAVLNLHLPKDHDLAGITGALKNMAFGNVDHVPEFHRVIHDAIPWVYNQPEIRDKVRLHLCDATRVLYNGGPQDKPRWRVPYDSILVSEDPVAMDWAVLDIVNAHRETRGLPRIEQIRKPRPRPPLFLKRAVAMGLGADLDQMRWTRVDDAGQVTRYTPAHISPLGDPAEKAPRPRGPGH